MLECWQESYDLRPSFESLRDRMKDMEKRHKVRIICCLQTKLSTTQCVAKDKFIFNMFLFVCLDAISLWCRTAGACRVEYYAHYENWAVSL